MRQTDIFAFTMMFLVCVMALYTFTNISDARVNRASLFALAMGSLGLAYFGYRLGKTLF